ncbi:hypothetical protein KQX54_015992 [Cotesia glomerata]|uniref:Uncharacterized protein n=1 Tax=Cotesia glomerata TaxID=32391 RepID=A0AAV7IFS6_COTGL|nr:hypothetical protein KQX54_015992 [Cotesia glomerata]
MKEMKENKLSRTKRKHNYQKTRSIETSTSPHHGSVDVGDAGTGQGEFGFGLGSDMGSINDSALVEVSTDLKDTSGHQLHDTRLVSYTPEFHHEVHPQDQGIT